MKSIPEKIKKKVFLLWPPAPSFYENLCYHYCEFGEVAGYLDDKVDLYVQDMAFDTSSNSLYKLAREILRVNPDFSVVYINFETLPIFKEIIDLIKATSASKIVTYGSPTYYSQKQFLDLGVDAVVFDGDPEAAIFSYVNNPELARGIMTEKNRIKGIRLPSGEWGFPAIALLPLEKYKLFSKQLCSNSERAGIRGLNEFSLTVSRGCNSNCNFCKTVRIEGGTDRRREISDIINHLNSVFSKNSYDYFSVYSPNFTYNKEYVLQFSKNTGERGYKWKCVTSVNLLDKELIKQMSLGGCVRIGLGVETFSPIGRSILKIDKKNDLDSLQEVIYVCKENKIDPHCFLMLGVPGETKKTFVNCVKTLTEWGASLRIVAYTPQHELNNDSSWEDLIHMNRKLHICNLPDGMSKQEYYTILFNQEKWCADINKH